jgi:hypothetical protein
MEYQGIACMRENWVIRVIRDIRSARLSESRGGRGVCVFRFLDLLARL